MSHVASAEGYRPVVRVTAKARSDPRTRLVGMLGAEGFWRVKRLRSVGTIHIQNDFHGFGGGGEVGGDFFFSSVVTPRA